MIKLQLQIQAASVGGGGAFVEVPEAAVQELGGGRKRLKVQATFDGVPYRGSIMPYAGRTMIGLLKEVRAQIGKDIGDTVQVTLALDEEERVVEVPPELARALAKSKLKAVFDALSFTNRKEYAAWIAGAKTAETRERRLLLAIEKLKAGKKNPAEK